jgi:hypothetical protein
MLLTNVWWSNVSAKMPTTVPSAENSTIPISTASARKSGSRTGTPVTGMAIAASPAPIISARTTPPRLKPRFICHGRIGADRTSLM